MEPQDDELERPEHSWSAQEAGRGISRKQKGKWGNGAKHTG